MREDKVMENTMPEKGSGSSKIVVVTGATSGIGLAVCRELASRGYEIIGIGRDDERCRRAVLELKRNVFRQPIACFCGDLMQQSEVFRLGAEIRGYLDEHGAGRLHALINNAGCVRSYYATTEEGYEQQFALNHLSGFLLTHILMPYLVNGRGRVLMTSSGSHRMMRMRWNDIMFKRGYNPLLAYKQSKLCNVLFAYGIRERFGAQGVSGYAIDPGLVRTDIGLKQTNGIVRLVWNLRRRGGTAPEAAARTYAYVLEEKEAPKGLYYLRCAETPYSGQVNRENADRLWALSEKLCGIAFGKEVCA